MTDEHRAIVIDTETTGFGKNDRIIEIGAVEIVNRKIGRTYEQRIFSGRDISTGAFEVHGISNADLLDMPNFANVIDTFLAFVGKADIIGHNLGFDLRFLDCEINRLPIAKWTTDVPFSFEKFVRDIPHKRSDIDTMKMMRVMFPGKKKSLNALCDYLKVDRTGRQEHGALKDAMLTALCWLAMTRKNLDMFQEQKPKKQEIIRLNRTDKRKKNYVPPLMVIRATDEEEQSAYEFAGFLSDDPFPQKKMGQQ